MSAARGGSRRGGRRRASRIDPARLAAYRALRRVSDDDAFANLTGVEEFSRLEGCDADFATELLHGTCRLMGTYDRIIAAASGRRLTALQPEVIDVLRLGAHQVFSMRVPDHAAVAASVDLAREVIGERVTGLVNAVTRKLTKDSLDAWTERLSRDESVFEALAIRHHHPAWIVRAFADALGVEPDDPELAAALEADNIAPRTALAVRPGLAEVDDLVAHGAEPIPDAPYGAWFSGDPGRIPEVITGRAGVQDPGSQRSAQMLAEATAPDGPWLDICAGPGGKAALLAGLAQESGTRLVASEKAPHRAELVRQALRTYPTRPPVVVADGTASPWRAGAFAKVMADVPCSGLGALRRRPEARWRKTPEDLADLVPLQRALLGSALEALMPGGIAAYVTCSPHLPETTGVVEHVLGERSGFSIEYEHQLWPHRDGTDAMFCALIRREGPRSST